MSRPSGAFDPAEDGLDFWESFEGMLVQMNDLLATQIMFTNFGEAFVLGDNGANATVLSPAGSVVISEGDLNPEWIVIDDEWFKAGGPPAMPAVNVGGTFPGPHVGIMEGRRSVSTGSSSASVPPSARLGSPCGSRPSWRARVRSRSPRPSTWRT